MHIKTKLWIGVIFLFVINVLLGGLGVFYMHRISSASEKIMQDNYRSLEITKAMLGNVEQMKDLQEIWFFYKDSIAVAVRLQDETGLFEANLSEEEHNITENGEQQAVDKITGLLADLKVTTGIITTDTVLNQNLFYAQVEPLYQQLRTSIQQVSEINLNAIKRKYDAARKISTQAIMYMSFIASLFILITLSFALNFPALANPIRELTESIKEIANKNYQQRLDYHSNDEFGELAGAFNAMAEKLQEYENSNITQLLAEKNRIETIIRSMNDPVIGLDENFTVLFANPAALSFFGFLQQDLIEKSIKELAPKNKLIGTILSDLSGDSQVRKKHENELIRIQQDEKELFYSREYIEVFSSPVNTTGEILIGHVIILKNVTSFKELDAAKTRFLATISHELKTPIATIRMSIKLLENLRVGKLNKEQTELVDDIRTETDRLSRITSELLNLTQIETGNIQLLLKMTDISELVHKACDMMKLQADAKGIRIIAEPIEKMPSVHIDTDKTLWVLLNLISNAIQHSMDNSEVIIRLSSLGFFVKVEVEDHGEGIPAEYHDKIFQRYFKTPGSKETGTGLGLAISKEFITAQGGKIWVESEPAKGSRFFFTLPVAPKS